jgi:hypothetical protein
MGAAPRLFIDQENTPGCQSAYSPVDVSDLIADVVQTFATLLKESRKRSRRHRGRQQLDAIATCPQELDLSPMFRQRDGFTIEDHSELLDIELRSGPEVMDRETDVVDAANGVCRRIELYLLCCHLETRPQWMPAVASRRM